MNLVGNTTQPIIGSLTAHDNFLVVWEGSFILPSDLTWEDVNSSGMFQSLKNKTEEWSEAACSSPLNGGLLGSLCTFSHCLPITWAMCVKAPGQLVIYFYTSEGIIQIILFGPGRSSKASWLSLRIETANTRDSWKAEPAF